MLLTMESKAAAAHKLEQLIARGRSKAGEVIDYVMNNQPTDRLTRGAEISFDAEDDRAVQINYSDSGTGKIQQRLHRHAIQQMAQTVDLPLKFIDSLQTTPEPWAKQLLAHNLGTVFSNRFPKNRYLLRSVSGEVRGFLSDRYRRLDSRPIIEAFAMAVQQKGAQTSETAHSQFAPTSCESGVPTWPSLRKRCARSIWVSGWTIPFSIPGERTNSTQRRP